MQISLGSASEDKVLPSLRPELELLEGPEAPGGEATWTIADPVSNRFFRIGWKAFQLLARWDAGTSTALLARVRRETTFAATEDDVEALIRFAWGNGLTVNAPSGSSSEYLELSGARQQHWSAWLVHNYLFFRVPLVQPDRFLRATASLVAPLYGRPARYLVLLLGLTGLYLAARQWDTFINTFSWAFDPGGLLAFGLALMVVKVAHELGHAYTAAHFGCRVPTMGVAFLVMWPVLYTDATETWRLRSRRDRMLVGAAGMITEVALAMLATFAWAVLPDGPLRSAAFFVAAVSWVTSLLINANPCMRFDGYYLMSDWLGMDNLQDRAFARGRWALRKLLFGGTEPAPEPFEPRRGRGLVFYAWCVWVYRFFLFLSIGLLVYHFFFKAAGMLLFAIEIGWFIVLPVAREVSRWFQLRPHFAQGGHAMVTLLVVVAGVAAAVVPWRTRIEVPAVAEAATRALVHAPLPGRIETAHLTPGQQVARGDVLLALSSPDLDYRIEVSGQNLAVREMRLKRSAAGGENVASVATLRESLRAERSAHESLLAERERLVIRAPIAGTVADAASSLHAGRWISPDVTLALIVQPAGFGGRGLAQETDVAWLQAGQQGRFYPEDGALNPVVVTITDVEQASVGVLDRPYLASEYSGAVAVRPGRDGELHPERAVYRVRFKLAPDDSGRLPLRTVRGTINLDGPGRSLAQRVFERVMAVLVRESGF